MARRSNLPPLTPQQQQLVADNLPLAQWAVGHFRSLANALGREETISLAYQGICRAAQTYDPCRARFGTYAVHAIRTALLDAYRKHQVVRTPKRHRESVRCVQLDTMDREMLSPLACEVHTPALDIADELARHLDALRPHERQVIALRYGLDGLRPHTLHQVGEVMGLSKQRVSQIQASAMKRMRLETGGDHA